MYLNHDEILYSGIVTNLEESCLNAASVDVRLGDEILLEVGGETLRILNYSKRDKISVRRVEIPDCGIVIQPRQSFIASTIENFDFPDDIGGLFRSKSSMGRIFLEHMDSGWIDPGFYGVLTLEFKNMSEHHAIRLHKGDRIGQVIFLQGNAVEKCQSYRTKGNYNGQTSATLSGFKK